MEKSRIICTVTNDLNQDQRLARICDSLQKEGFDILLVGRHKPDSKPLINRSFQQIRLYCFFSSGFLFYAEYNLRLCWFLLRQSFQYTYAVDLDTVLPAFILYVFRRKKFIFDAHELFTETPELENRSLVKKVWARIGKLAVPSAAVGLTVNKSLADLLSRQYGLPFTDVYNAPRKAEQPDQATGIKKDFHLVYQGVLNKGRGLECLIKAMEYLPESNLVIVGEGDLSAVLRALAANSPAADRIHFTGWLFGEALREVTLASWVGINILESSSLNYYYSLANKFFDYMHAGIPAIHMSFPEYERILNEFPVGLTIEKIEVDQLVRAVKFLMENPEKYEGMKKACSEAKEIFNWQKEEKKLFRALHQSGLI